MPVDASIYSQQKTPDIMGGIQKGLNMRKMIDQRNEEQGIKDAYAAGVVQNPDGTSSFDSQKTLSGLYKVNPQKAVEYDTQIKNQNAADLKLKREKINEQTEYLGRAYQQMKKTNGQGYQALLADAKNRGYETSTMPPVWGPEAEQQLSYHYGQALTISQQLDQQNKERDYKYKDQEMGIKREELGIKRNEAGVKRQKDISEAASGLRKERSGLPVTRATQEISAAYNKIQTAAKNPSAAGDLSLIFGYMKMLDPGSTVREGEFATAQNAAGVPDRILNAYNNSLRGERLNPDQRSDFIGQAGGIYKSQLAIQNQVDSQYSDMAKKSGVNPNDVILNFSANNPNAVQSQKTPVFKTSDIEW